MKNILLLLIVCFCYPINTECQSYDDNQSMTVNASKYDMVRVHNYNGNVTVREGNGNSVSIKSQRKLKSKNNNKLDQARSEVFLDTAIIDGELIFFVNVPDRKLEIDEKGNGYYNSGWDNNWSKRNIKEYEVQYEFTIEVSIPSDKDVYASTHRKNLDVKGFSGKLIAKNHHGNVKVETGSSAPIVKTHHGDIEVLHTSSGITSGIYKTHHGDIRTTFRALSAEVSLSTHHGSFYTDFDYNISPMKVTSSKARKGTKYKLGGNTGIKIGNGNATLEYKTHHGDTYITKT